MKKKILLVLLFVGAIIYAQEQPSFSDTSANTKEITTRYFNDYIALDFEAMQPLMDNDISFNDATAKLIFGIELVEGKTQVVENFKKTYAAIVEMKSEVIRTLFSSNVGVFEIQLTYKFKVETGKTITIKKMPLIVILTVKDDKISEHRDYGDYNHFLEQYKKQSNQ